MAKYKQIYIHHKVLILKYKNKKWLYRQLRGNLASWLRLECNLRKINEELILSCLKKLKKMSIPYDKHLAYLYNLLLSQLIQMDIIFLSAKVARITVKTRTRDVTLHIRVPRKLAQRLIPVCIQEPSISNPISPVKC